jgi:Family of unknown function (DUF6056)
VIAPLSRDGILRARGSSLAILFLALVVLAPFFVLSVYNHPLADDFCVTAKVRQLGFWPAQVYWYQTWTGRYSALALVSSFTVLSDWMVAHKVLPALVVALLGAAIYLFVRELLSARSSRREPLIIAGSILFLYLLRMPSIVEGIYWLDASLIYQVPNALTLILGVAIIRREKEQSPRKRLLLTVLAQALVVAIVGMNETSMLILDILLLAIAVLVTWRRRRVDGFLLSLVITAALCSLVVIAAPGNSVRLAYFPDRGRPVPAAVASLKALFGHAGRWLVQSPLILLTLLYLPVGARISRQRPDNRGPFTVHPLVSLGLFAGLLSLAWFPAYWSMGLAPPPRTVNVIYFLFLLGWFYNVQVWLEFVRRRNGAPFPSLPRYAVVLIGIAVAAYLPAGNNVKTAWGDLVKGRAATYDREMRRRYAEILRCDAPVCEVPALTARPSSLLFNDMTNDERFWINECAAKVFGKPAIRIRRVSDEMIQRVPMDPAGHR